MSTYEDWNPDWRPVGDPVPIEEGASEYDWGAEDSPGEEAPRGPALPSIALAGWPSGDASAHPFDAPPDQDEASVLEDNPELAVFRRWRAQLGLPVEPEPFPDESQRAQDRAAVTGPALPFDWTSTFAPTPLGGPLGTEQEGYTFKSPIYGYDGEIIGYIPGLPDPGYTLLTPPQAPPLPSKPSDVLARLGRAVQADIPRPVQQLGGLVEQGLEKPGRAAMGEIAEPVSEITAALTSDIVREYVPGVAGTEDILAQVADKFRYQPTAILAGEIHRERERWDRAWGMLTPEEQSALVRGDLEGWGWQIGNSVYSNAMNRWGNLRDELAHAEAPQTLEDYQRRFTEDVGLHEARTPAWAQVALSFVDPTNVAMDLPFRMASAGLNARRVGALQKAIAGLDISDDSYWAVQAAIKTAKAEGLGSQEASRILKSAKDLLLEGPKGQDRLSKVLNENKAAEVAAFTRDNLAGRTDEANAILTKHVSKEKGVGPFDIPMRERWGLLMQPKRDDLGKISLIHSATGLESKRAYDFEKRPRGWFEAIINSRDLSAVNEAFGHAAGDDLLTATGRFVKAKVEQAGGRAFHHHGDEIRLWFPDEATAKRTLTAIDQGLKEHIIPMRLRDGTIAPKKGFSIAYGYGKDETAAKKALDAQKHDRGRTGESSGRGILSRRVVDAGTASGRRGHGQRDIVGNAVGWDPRDLEARQVETTRPGRVAGPHTPLSPADEWLSSQLLNEGLSLEETRAILSDPVRREAALARARYLTEASGEILPPGAANIAAPTAADLPAAVERAFGGSKYSASVPLYKRWDALPPSMKHQISKSALTDALTGLESRYVYELERKPKGWADAISDVNGLGGINKTLGPEVGNDLIAHMGSVVKANIEREGGRAFRYGGDEIKYWFPDEASARRALTAIDRGVKETVIKVPLPNGSVKGKKGFTLSYGYGPDELAADKALNDYKLAGEGTYRAPKGVLPNTIGDAPLPPQMVGEGNRARSTAARMAGAALATAGRARHAQAEQGPKPASVPRTPDVPGAPRAEEPRVALQYLRQQLSKLGHTASMIDQLSLGQAAQIIAEGRGATSGSGSGRGAAPGGVGPSQRRSRSRPPLSLSQQMARLYRGTIAGDDYWSPTRGKE